MRSIPAATATFLLLGLTGCSTILNGTKQRIEVSSTPTAAKVTVDGQERGVTPMTLYMPRKDGHRVKIEAPGYMPANVTLSQSTAGAFWCNCFTSVLAPITFSIDYIDGAMYTLSPAKISEELTPWAGAAAATTAVTPVGPPRNPNAVRLNLAVSELAGDGVSATDASVIANLLRGELVKTGAFNVVEKKNMDRILAEQAFQQTGCTAQDCAVKLGKLLNVQRMIVGSCGKLMGRYFISIRVVNVESGEATFADEAKGDNVDAIETGVRAMAGRMAQRQL